MPDTSTSPQAPTSDVAVWFDRHARALGDYAARRVGTSLARDIVAETFRVACERLDVYEPGRGGERAWLFGIATNLIRRHWRTEERRLRVQARAAQRDERVVDPLLRVDEQVHARARYELVVDAISALSAGDRDVLVLVAWEQMNSREVADVLGIPAGTVRSRLSRIRVELARTADQGDAHG